MLLLGGELVAVVTRDDTLWPLSSVPMFSQMPRRTDYSRPTLRAVTDDGEIDLVDEGVFGYRIERLLVMGFLRHERGKTSDVARRAYRRALVETVATLYARAEREAGLRAVRVVELTWDLAAVRADPDLLPGEVVLFEDALP